MQQIYDVSTPCHGYLPILKKVDTAVQILNLMAQEKGWWWFRKRAELKRARQYLATFQATPEIPDRVEIAEQADGISSPV